MWHKHYGYHSYYITNTWVQMYMCQLTADRIIKTAPPQSTYLFDTQVIQVTRVSMAGKGRFDKNKQKLPGKLSSVYDYGNLNDSNNWYGLDCT